MKMSTENTCEQEHRLVESVSIKTVELVASIKNTCDIVEISMDAFKISKSLYDVIMIQQMFPSRNTYKRIKIIEKKLNRLFHDVIKHKDTKCTNAIILGVAYLLMSWAHTKVIRKESSQDYIKIYLIRCLELLEGKETDRIVILLAIRTLNHLGDVYFKLGKLGDSILTFERAIQLYLTYTQRKDNYPAPFNILIIVGSEEHVDCKYLLEEMYVTILQKLLIGIEKVYQTNEHTNILRKLEYLNQYLKYIPLTVGSIKFVLHTASISEYFLLHKNFTKARNCLAAAHWLLLKFRTKVFTKGNTERFPDENTLMHSLYESINKQLGKYWGRYGLALLHSSTERLLQCQEENESFETDNLQLELSTKSNEQLNASTLFANIGEELKTCNIITDKYLTYYTDAKDVYLHTLHWFNKAQTYYTLDKYKIEHIALVQDVSKVHKYFAYYEKDLEKHVKQHLLRIIDLENILKSLNERHDRDICKQIWIELAVIYSTLLDITTRYKYKNNNVHNILVPDQLATYSKLNLELYLN